MNKPEPMPTTSSDLATPAATDLESEVRALFDEPAVPASVTLQYLQTVIQNLTTTERAIGSDFLRITLAFIAFLLLDAGLVDKVALVGADIKRSGLLLLLFPILIAYLTYQLNSRIAFAHELRTVIAFLYGHLGPAIYRQGLDLLTHYPSVRNIESFHGRLVGKRGERFLDYSTTVVALVLGMAPFLAVGYCFFRTFSNSDIRLAVWSAAALLGGLLLFRTFALYLFERPERDKGYSVRSRKWRPGRQITLQ